MHAPYLEASSYMPCLSSYMEVCRSMRKYAELICPICGNMVLMTSHHMAVPSISLALFPGPTQLSVACSTESDGKLSGAWERGY